MNDESATELLLVLAAWVCGALAAVVSFMRAVIAAVSASRLEELHPEHPAVLDKIYDARRLGSVERTVLMVADVALVAALAAVLSVLGMVWWGWADGRVFLMLGAIVAVIVIGKATVHALGDLVADAAILLVARWLDVVLRIARPLATVIATVMEMLHARRHHEDAREQVAEELSAIMEEAVEEGTLEAEEVRILQNIMRVRDVHVEDVMTPRNVVAGLPADIPIGHAAELPELQTYSRLPGVGRCQHGQHRWLRSLARCPRRCTPGQWYPAGTDPFTASGVHSRKCQSGSRVGRIFETAAAHVHRR